MKWLRRTQRRGNASAARPSVGGRMAVRAADSHCHPIRAAMGLMRWTAAPVRLGVAAVRPNFFVYKADSQAIRLDFFLSPCLGKRG
jgi:hypothetical protein